MPLVTCRAMRRNSVSANVDVIVACSNDEARAAMRATSRIPIVLLYGFAPVEAGLVASLARPGRKPHRLSRRSRPTSAGKSVEIFKERGAVAAAPVAITRPDVRHPVGKVLHGADRGRQRSSSALRWRRGRSADEAGLAESVRERCRETGRTGSSSARRWARLLSADHRVRGPRAVAGHVSVRAGGAHRRPDGVLAELAAAVAAERADRRPDPEGSAAARHPGRAAGSLQPRHQPLALHARCR